jgi:hypothetical protein
MTTATIPSLRAADRRTAGLAFLALAGVLFAAMFEQGALTGGQPLLHELVHDARHLLGLPCH